MDSYQAIINERKRREMEAEMNRFEQEISSRPVYNNYGVNSSTTVHFIPHQIQRQLPRNQSHNQMQTSYEAQQQQQQQQQNNNYVINSQSHSSNNNNNNINSNNNSHNSHQMGFTVSPMAIPSASHQTSVVSTHDSSQSNTNSNKKSKNNSGEKGKKVKKMLRMAGGTIWEDSSLMEWGNDDFRIFCGDLGNDVTDDVLARAFNRFSSFTKAKVIRDKRTNKSKGYGFVSFKDPQDFARAIKEMNGKYVGSRPIKLRKSMWKDRNYDVVRKKIKTKAKLGLI